MQVEAIIAIVERGKADKLVESAKKAGATGATIFYGRGTGAAEAKKIWNLHIESSKEIVLFLTEVEKTKAIVDAVILAGKLNDPGTGIVFTFPVSNLVGLHHRSQSTD